MWLLDAGPASPTCTPLHMAAALPDGGKLATAILARHPEVLRLWLGLPLEPCPPFPGACARTTSSSATSPLEGGRASVAGAVACRISQATPPAAGPAPSPTALLLDPRPSSPAALAAACGNWVRTAWAQSKGCNSSSCASSLVQPGSRASTDCSSAASAVAGAQLPGAQPLPPACMPAPGAWAPAAVLPAAGAELRTRPAASAGPLRVVLDDRTSPAGLPLEHPPFGRATLLQAESHVHSPQATPAHRAPAPQPPPPQQPQRSLVASPAPAPRPSPAAPCSVPQPALGTEVGAVRLPPGAGACSRPCRAGCRVAALAMHFMKSKAQQLGAWVGLLGRGFSAREDAVVLGVQQAGRGSCPGDVFEAWQEGSVLEARYMRAQRGLQLGGLLRREGSGLSGAWDGMEHKEVWGKKR